MSADPQTSGEPQGIEMPRPTVAPVVLAVGLLLMGAGVVLNLAFAVVGGVIFLVGMSMWIMQLLPGRGHFHQATGERRPIPIAPAAGTVEQLVEGMPGYRMRLPLFVHPISAGVKGGLLGGLLMPIPALLWGFLSGHGIWYPINLLAGMVTTNLGTMPVAELERFRLSLFLIGLIIHVIMSVVVGLMYGVLMPTLPYIHRSIAWGALVMPILWTVATFSLMSAVAPVLAQGVSWPWFILSQFLFGIVAGPVIMQADGRRTPIGSGIIGGLAGGLVMPLPALCWGFASGHGIWYPVNLLAGMIMPRMSELPLEALTHFRRDWLIAGLVIHGLMSIGFGIVYAFVLPKLPSIPAPLSWGGVLLPLLWTSASYALMGVVNPLLQDAVDWPWFIVSQFVFGLAAAYVVVRTETIAVPPAGTEADTAALTR